MAQGGRQSARNSYDKPSLKERIDRGMAAFANAGKRVEQVPAMVISEPPSVADAAILESRARQEAAQKKARGGTQHKR